MSESSEQVLEVNFEGVSPAQANQAVQALDAELRLLTRGEAQTGRRKARDDTQDFGTILTIVVCSEMALVIAKGIRDFVAKHGDRVVIKLGENEVVATGDAASNIDVAAVVRAIEDGSASEA